MVDVGATAEKPIFPRPLEPLGPPATGCYRGRANIVGLRHAEAILAIRQESASAAQAGPGCRTEKTHEDQLDSSRYDWAVPRAPWPGPRPATARESAQCHF